jgi:hypothetical protein
MSHLLEVLKGWQTLQQYREGREAFYPTEGALRWIIRQHRADLVAAGALAMPGQKLLIEPAKFDAAVLAIAQRRAEAA